MNWFHVLYLGFASCAIFFTFWGILYAMEYGKWVNRVIPLETAPPRKRTIDRLRDEEAMKRLMLELAKLDRSEEFKTGVWPSDK